MRYKNSSSLVVPRAIWQFLAADMGLDGALPGALADSVGMYLSKTLRITVHRERRVQSGRMVTPGSYTYGHISLSPCVHCTPAFLTQVYLHELVHAWLHQYWPDLSRRANSCRLAERFANAGFRALGGKMREVRLCGSYSLPSRVTLARLYDFRTLAESLTGLLAAAVHAWHPKVAKEKRARLEG
jgi:hypothetical protein